MTKLFSPAAERNKDAIIDAIRSFLPSSGIFLEIASGSGQHALALSEAFQGIIWQPTDYGNECVESIQSYLKESPRANVLEPFQLDTTSPPKNLPRDYKGLICCNMIHISPWNSCIGLMQIASNNLQEKSQIFIYGPFIRDGIETAPSNLEFDRSLKSRNAEWGIRHLNDVCDVADKFGLRFNSLIDMPANNLIVIFDK